MFGPAKVKLLGFYFFIWCILIPVVGSTTLTSADGVKLIASPSSIHQDFTKELTINCSISQDQGLKFSTILSMILSKASKASSDLDRETANSPAVQDTQYRELATVTSQSRYNVNIKDAIGAHVTGQLPPNTEAFISYQWSYPRSEVVGSYKCEVFGMDDLGHPFVSSALAEIKEREVDMSMVLEEMKRMNLKQEDLTSKLNQTVEELTDVKSRLKNTSGELNELKRELTASRAAIFEVCSGNHRGHHYCLSRPSWIDIASSDSVCRLFGGYIVEINDQQEYDFVFDLISKNVPKGVTYTFIGAHDSTHIGNWTYIFSGGPMVFSKWQPGEPEGKDGENCVAINVNTNTMIDIKCTISRILYDFTYLCEIPNL